MDANAAQGGLVWANTPTCEEVAAQLAGAKVFRTTEPDGKPIRNHAKFVAVDHQFLIVTSANFSKSAEERNIELGLRVQSRSLDRIGGAPAPRLRGGPLRTGAGAVGKPNPPRQAVTRKWPWARPEGWALERSDRRLSLMAPALRKLWMVVVANSGPATPRIVLHAKLIEYQPPSGKPETPADWARNSTGLPESDYPHCRRTRGAAGGSHASISAAPRSSAPSKTTIRARPSRTQLATGGPGSAARRMITGAGQVGGGSWRDRRGRPWRGCRGRE